MRAALVASALVLFRTASAFSPAVYGACEFNLQKGESANCSVAVPGGNIVTVGGCSLGASVTGTLSVHVVSGGEEIAFASESSECKNPQAPNVNVQVPLDVTTVILEVSCATVCSGRLEVTDPFDASEVALADAYSRLQNGCASVRSDCLNTTALARSIRNLEINAANPREEGACTGVLVPSFESSAGRAMIAVAKVTGMKISYVTAWSGGSARVVVVADNGARARVLHDAFVTESAGMLMVPIEYVPDGSSLVFGIFGDHGLSFAQEASVVSETRAAVTFGWCVTREGMSLTPCTPLLAFHYEACPPPPQQPPRPAPPPLVAKATRLGGVCLADNAGSYYVSVAGTSLCLQEKVWAENGNTLSLGTNVIPITDTDGSASSLVLRACTESSTMFTATAVAGTAFFTFTSPSGSTWGIHPINSDRSPNHETTTCNGGSAEMVFYNYGGGLAETNAGYFEVDFDQTCQSASVAWRGFSLETSQYCTNSNKFSMSIASSVAGESPYYFESSPPTRWMFTKDVPTQAVEPRPSPRAPLQQPTAPPVPPPPPPPFVTTPDYVTPWRAIVLVCNSRDSSNCLAYNATKLVEIYTQFLTDSFISPGSTHRVEIFTPRPADELETDTTTKKRTIVVPYRFINGRPNDLLRFGIPQDSDRNGLFTRLPDQIRNENVSTFEFRIWTPPSPPASSSSKPDFFSDTTNIAAVAGAGGGFVLLLVMCASAFWYYRPGTTGPNQFRAALAVGGSRRRYASVSISMD